MYINVILEYLRIPITNFTNVMIIIYVINIAFVSAVIFMERRNPAATWAWITIIIFVPFVGFIFYLLFGQDGRRQKIFSSKAKNDKLIYDSFIQNFSKRKYYETIVEQKKSIGNQVALLGTPEAASLEDLVFLNLSTGYWLSGANKVDLFFDGETKFGSLIQDIKNAKEFIFMEYYIWRNDSLGRQIIDELAKKASEGVEVKVIFDGMGCISEGINYFRPIINAGGKADGFFPPFFPFIHIRFNYRNHRKICIIDGKIGYLGGFNIGDEYLGIVKRFGNWRDTHMRLTGEAVIQLTLRFIMDWNFSSDTRLALSSRYFPEFPAKKNSILMQIVSSGPDTAFPNIKNGYFKMINEAQRRIYLVTPYFVPDDSIISALKVAALSGIDIRIVFPAHPDHPFVYWASLSYLGELLKVGVRCFQYEKGFIHSKTLMIDGFVSSIGTANMDIRSFHLNFEVNSFIYNKEICDTLEKKFLSDLNDCDEITLEKYLKRGRIVKIKESFARLISPIL